MHRMCIFRGEKRCYCADFGMTKDDVESVMAVFTDDGVYRAFGDTYPLADFPTLTDPKS